MDDTNLVRPTLRCMRGLHLVDVEPGASGVARLRAALNQRIHHEGPAVAAIPAVSRHVSSSYRDGVRAALRLDAVPDDVAVVVATSGSTGTPRPVLITADNLRAAAEAAAIARPGLADCAWVLALPATSIGGLNVVARAEVNGTELRVLPSVGGATAFDPDELTRFSMDTPFAISLVPSQLHAIVESASATRWLARAHTVLVGGAATPDALIAAATDNGIAVVPTYGMTETTGGCVFDGRPLPGVGVAIAEDGRISISGAMVAAGYASGPEGGFSDDRPHRRFTTQDHGRWEGDRLHVHGRIDDVITVHGVNVALGPIESLLREQPGIRAAAVISRPDPIAGQRPTAYVVADEGVDLASIADTVREILGGAARPRMERVDVLPMLPNGKIDRLALKAHPKSKGTRN